MLYRLGKPKQYSSLNNVSKLVLRSRMELRQINPYNLSVICYFDTYPGFFYQHNHPKVQSIIGILGDVKVLVYLGVFRCILLGAGVEKP